MAYLIIIAASILLSAFFSGMEIAFVSSNKLRIELDKKQGNSLSRLIHAFSKNPSQYLATMLIGNNIALVVYGLIMAKVLNPVIEVYIQSDVLVLLIETILSTLIILFLAEYLPKSLFAINPNNALNIFAVPTFLFFILFYPVAALITGVSRLTIQLIFGKKISKDSKLTFTKHDLDNLVNESNPENKDTEVPQDVKIFQNALDFSEIKLRECIIPRTEIVAISIDDTVDSLKQKFIDTGLSKILVYEGSLDNIIGFAPSIRLFENPTNIKSLVRRLPIVPESMPANKLLASFIQTQKNIALVVDEFGGTSGIVTMEDILEEIVGDIQDEHDKVQLIDKQLSENEFEFSGRLEIDDIEEKYALGIPVSEEYETLAGYILSVYGSIPHEGEEVVIEPFKFTILKATSTRIDLVHVQVKNML
jgi:CBS domain containing-hemolysin-like protein